MNMKKPRIKKYDYDQYPHRDFEYSLIHWNVWSIRDIMVEFSPFEVKMLFGFSSIIKRNSNMIMNLAGQPAENREEILSALGYVEAGHAPKNAIAHFVKEEIILRVKDDNVFGGYAYYFNPHVMYYGATLFDSTLELFHDSRWRK